MIEGQPQLRLWMDKEKDVFMYLKNILKSKNTFEHNDAACVLMLMLLFLASTLLQGLFPFSVNRVIMFLILVVIAWYNIRHLTTWCVLLYGYIAVGAVFTFVRSSDLFLNVEDWIYFAATLMFVDFVSDESIIKAFDVAIEACSKLINVVSLIFCGVTLVSLALPSSYGDLWGGTYYVGFVGDAHPAANSLCLLMAFRVLSYRGKPFSLLDLCQLMFIMAVIFMTGARTYVITGVIIVYAYLAKKIYNRKTKMLMYWLILFAILAIFVKTKMLEKFLWTMDPQNTNAIDQLAAITGGRSVFWMYDFREFAEANWIEKILGCGFDRVYQTNLKYTNMKIWAQNDLIHLLVGTGLLSVIVYMAIWICFGLRYKKYIKSWLLGLCIFAYIAFPMMFNGVFVHPHYMMSFFIFTFFLAFEDEKQDSNFKNKKLNISMFGHKRIPSREGGVEIVVEELSTRMAAQGHAVTCYSRKGHHVSGAEFDTETLKEYKGVRIRSVPTINRKGIAAVTSSFFAALASSFGKVDLVHIHAEGPAFMCWIPRLFGKRVAVTVHGLDWQREKWKGGGFASKFIRLGEKMAAYFADEIIVLSRNVQDYFWSTYRRETTWIPNGVVRPVCVEADEIEKQFGLTKDSYILFLGRLVPEKGIHYLVKAFQRVDTDKKLVIAGGASDTEEYLQRLQRLAAEDDRVIFTGFVQGRLLEELYSNAYVYVLPSDVEGMPLSLLEAMSFGNCCLTSDIEECTEVTRKYGVAFRKGNITDLAEKLQNLCQNTDLVARYKAEAADYICQRYSWDTVVAQTLALYRGDGNNESIAGQ